MNEMPEHYKSPGYDEMTARTQARERREIADQVYWRGEPITDDVLDSLVSAANSLVAWPEDSRLMLLRFLLDGGSAGRVDSNAGADVEACIDGRVARRFVPYEKLVGGSLTVLLDAYAACIKNLLPDGPVRK